MTELYKTSHVRFLGNCNLVHILVHWPGDLKASSRDMHDVLTYSFTSQMVYATPGETYDICPVTPVPLCLYCMMSANAVIGKYLDNM